MTRIALCLALLFLITIRPVFGADISIPLRSEIARPNSELGPTKIGVGVWLADVSRIDSAAQTFTANFFLVLTWHDPSLAHGQPGVRQIHAKDIWYPTWIITNANSSLSTSLPDVVEVAGDGTVYYRQRLLGSFSQPLDLHQFPFDSAAFRINLAFINHGPGELQFVPNERMVSLGVPNAVGLAPELTLQDWRITQFIGKPSPYQIGPGLELAGFLLELKADRLQQHYVTKVIVPLFVIVMMSWLVFWIDQSLGSSKISVAVTSMLTLIAYRFAIGNEVPKLPYLTSLDAFIFISTILVFLALIEVITTSALWSNDRKTMARKIDRYCRVIFPIAFVVLIVTSLIR